MDDLPNIAGGQGLRQRRGQKRVAPWRHIPRPCIAKDRSLLGISTAASPPNGAFQPAWRGFRPNPSGALDRRNTNQHGFSLMLMESDQF